MNNLVISLDPLGPPRPYYLCQGRCVNPTEHRFLIASDLRWWTGYLTHGDNHFWKTHRNGWYCKSLLEAMLRRSPP